MNPWNDKGNRPNVLGYLSWKGISGKYHKSLRKKEKEKVCFKVKRLILENTTYWLKKQPQNRENIGTCIWQRMDIHDI